MVLHGLLVHHQLVKHLNPLLQNILIPRLSIGDVFKTFEEPIFKRFLDSHIDDKHFLQAIQTRLTD